MTARTCTYSIVRSAPPPLDWVAYATRATAEWRALLDADASESKFQRFLEQYPCFLPGAWTPGSTSGHAPYPLAVISQPRLGGSFTRVPDFCWISTHSTDWFPTFIEIERPSKSMFRTKGTQQRSEFTQARGQIKEWQAWIRDPGNAARFGSYIGIPERMCDRQMTPHFILVYGRRAEFEGHERRTKLRAQESDLELMTYDRLSPLESNRDFMTVRAKGDGRFEAIAVQPTMSIGPDFARETVAVDGIEVAVQKCEQMPSERREFLLRRLPYWREWAANHDNGVTASNPFE